MGYNITVFAAFYASVYFHKNVILKAWEAEQSSGSRAFHLRKELSALFLLKAPVRGLSSV
jgi:hypothetical protein